MAVQQDEQQPEDFKAWVDSLTPTEYEALDNGEDLVLAWIRERTW